LKVSALFIVTGLIPFLVGLFSIFALYGDGAIQFGFISFALAEHIKFVWFIGVIVGFFIFFIGLFKAIGDITEAALIE
jgi:hypothetical protein